ncbi:MAG: sortase [Sphingomonadaceae bacterium]
MNRHRLIGNFLLLAGVVSLLLAGVTYFSGQVDGGRVLPQPVALAGGTTGTDALPGGASSAQRGETPDAMPAGMATVEPTEMPVLTATPVPVKPGIPVRVVIPSIEVDSQVKQAGTYWENGQLLYETLPFVVAHYKMTAKAGEEGNAVFSGHVTSRNAGNVFRDLYKVNVGDEVILYSEEDEYRYVVTEVRLVEPTDVSVMDPTPDATATLITCAGEWIPAERQYSQRLIVTAKLKR